MPKMPSSRVLSLPVLLSLSAVIGLVVACDSADVDAQACRNIPANGCTLESGVACQDPSCAAVYQCNSDGSWTLEETCPNFQLPDAGADGASDAASGDAGPGHDAAFPYPIPPGAYGGPDCIDLQEPDCALGTVVGCADAVDTCCGCETLFVCQGDEWVVWGECEPDGGIVDNGK
jgi:hypothetical protein